MSVFRFRLSSVLQFRERIKEEKQWELRALNEAQRELENEIGALEESLVRAAGEMAKQQGQVLSVFELRLQGDYAQRMAQLIREKHVMVEAVRRKLSEKRDELIEADRAVKSLELLRNRFYAKFQRAQNTEEQKLVDEIGQRKFMYARKNFPR